MLKKAFVLALIVALILSAANAFAITYGRPDEGRHPEVGALVVLYQGTWYAYCSGTLISPTVFLTAAHCGEPGEAVTVTFDEITPQATTFYTGTFIPDSLYNQRQSDTHDIAVVIFSNPVTGITPALLPTAGMFDNVARNQAFTAVGYGGQEPTNEPGPGGWVINYLDRREFAVSTHNATNNTWLRLSMNAATGDGGTCYGDSGGPNFLGAGTTETNVIAAITVTGDIPCKATNVVYRLDTASARNFLANYVTLP